LDHARDFVFREASLDHPDNGSLERSAPLRSALYSSLPTSLARIAGVVSGAQEAPEAPGR